jgi:hypothetical protein
MLSLLRFINQVSWLFAMSAPTQAAGPVIADGRVASSVIYVSYLTE